MRQKKDYLRMELLLQQLKPPNLQYLIMHHFAKFCQLIQFIIEFKNVIITTYPGAENCLKYLSELCCESNTCTEFFYRLSQICHNLQVLDLKIRNVISKGLTDLISVQGSLKHLKLDYHYDNK